jgi:hypothetical protein
MINFETMSKISWPILLTSHVTEGTEETVDNLSDIVFPNCGDYEGTIVLDVILCSLVDV